MIMIYGHANLHKHHDGCSLFELLTDVGESTSVNYLPKEVPPSKELPIIHAQNNKFKENPYETIKSAINHFR